MKTLAPVPTGTSRESIPFPRLIGIAVAALGAVILAGWFLGIPTLTSGGPEHVPTNPSIALALALAGVSMLLVRAESERGARRTVAGLIAAIVVALGVGGWADALSGGRLSPDALLFGTRVGTAAAAWPGAISPGTAMALLLVGSALSLRLTPGLRLPCCVLMASAGAIPLLAMAVGATGMEGDRGLASIVFMGPLTAASLVALCAARVIERRCCPSVDRLSRSEAGGGLLRRLLPASVILPLVLYWFVDAGRVAGIYGHEFDLAVFATVNTLVIAILVLWNARLLDRSDADRSRAEEALRVSETEHRTLIEQLPGVTYAATFDEDSSVLYVSPQIEPLLGYTLAEWEMDPGLWKKRLHPEDRSRVLDGLRHSLMTCEPFAIEYRMIAREGRVVHVQDKAVAIRDASGRPVRFQGIMLDVTAQREAEERLRKTETQLRQSQKMDTIGRLAAGIAHDFNNLLTAILGRAELLLEQIDLGDPSRREVEEIRRAGERAAGLTRELLAFTRQQVLRPKVLDLNIAVSDMAPMLGRLIGENIELVGDFTPDLGSIRADPTQIEQVIMNLALNARDAMPRGGKLTIETRNVSLEFDEARRLGQEAGAYVMLSVHDTGAGIPNEVFLHLFEPFYTTKELGKGTGLGLATVQGIVKQSGGSIWVFSEPGEGSTFRIYFPRVVEEEGAVKEVCAPAASAPGKESVLLVEDEDGVRSLVGEVLEMKGYRVRSARDGVAAMRLLERLTTPIQLLITDVVMPGMGGRELADRMKSADPALRVLFMSGHTDDSVVRAGVLDCGTHFLQKPFAPDVLATKVREVLDEHAAVGGD